MTTDYRSSDGHVKLHHKDGLGWWKAPIPKRFHRCRVQTYGYLNLTFIERCACGAMRMDGGRWMARNSRRK